MEAPKQYHRHEHSGNLQLVMDAAGLLQIREFDLFRLAWCRWWGDEPDEKALEECFVAYMFQQTLPIWVRHYCREVLEREWDGRLDPAEFGVNPVARREPPVGLGKAFVGVTVAVSIVLYPLLLEATYDPQTSAPLACETGIGMQFFAGLAHALAGREPPGCLRPELEPKWIEPGMN
ncbi:MAG: hypothetical protein QNJ30_20630 [Kiloniellales bacterium]|nr:hypothetical protein [Kiloniellales bacterium]